MVNKWHAHLNMSCLGDCPMFRAACHGAFSEASMEAVKLQLTTHMASISTSQSIRLSSFGHPDPGSRADVGLGMAGMEGFS